MIIGFWISFCLFRGIGMSSVLRVRPTKIELIRLKRRRELAKKVHKILRERLTILVNEFLSRVRIAYRVRLEINNILRDVYRDSAYLVSLYGDGVFDYFRNTVREESRVVIGFENIMGVKSYTAMVRKGVFTDPMIELTGFRENSIKLIQKLIELGRIERSIISLGEEIRRTKRRVNALEYIFIPKLENTIRYLSMKFEEREREEKARLKRVKSMLEKKKGVT